MNIVLLLLAVFPKPPGSQHTHYPNQLYLFCVQNTVVVYKERASDKMRIHINENLVTITDERTFKTLNNSTQNPIDCRLRYE